MTNRYKLLFLDIDGTLTNSKKEITPFTRQTLIKAQQDGMRLVLASGRPVYGILPLTEMLEMNKYGGYILAFNGGKIIECHSQKVLYEQSLPDDILPTIYQQTTDAGATILYYNGPHVLTENPENIYVHKAAFLNKMEIYGTDNLLRDLIRPANKFLAVGEPELIISLEEKLKKEIGNKISIFRSEAFFLELVPKGIDKATSIDRLLELIGVDRKETIAMGDGFNDLSMLQYAGLGVAMANAQQSVKEKADAITLLSNDEDGVAHFLLEELTK